MGCGMDMPDSSFRCDVVSLLEERIWLDRRERVGRVVPAGRAGLGRIADWLRSQRARMQLGPLDDGSAWFGGDPDKRF